MKSKTDEQVMVFGVGAMIGLMAVATLLTHLFH